MEMNILQEAKLLARDYSDLRTNSRKWQMAQTQQKVEESIKISKDSQTVQISRDFLTVTVYSFKSLQRRFKLRRNPSLLRSVLSFWSKINSFGLGGISEKVYRALFSVLYSKLAKDNFVSTQIEQMVKNDQIIDFAGKTFLPFTEFYDSVFELIDSNTRSKLTSEYFHFSNQITAFCEDSSWSDGLNLYSKIHIDGKVKSYASWMKEVLKDDKKSQMSAKVTKNSHEVLVSQRLLSRKKFKPVDRDNFNIRKLEKVMSEKILKRRFKPESLKSPVKGKEIRIKVKDRRAVAFYSNYIDKISPLSSVHSVSRAKSNVLEHVINGRKQLKVEEVTELF